MAFLKVYDSDYTRRRSGVTGDAKEIVLNTPNRNEILKAGPPQNSQCNILGKGAYGTVFKAIFGAQQVAVKIVKNPKNINSQSMRNEAHILGWEQRNIVKILKVESTPNFGIIIMERFSGCCLQAVLDAMALSLEHRIFITLDIIAALAYCHKRQLLHLDVKPQNVLVAVRSGERTVHRNEKRSYICKLCDFGSSLKLSEQKENKTIAGIARGTVRYMSPEALRAELYTTAADVYSLGVTMWQLQHRRMPYDWIECNEAVAYQVVKQQLRPNAVTSHVRRALVERWPSAEYRNCYCAQYMSELSHQSLTQIKALLQRQTDAEEKTVNSKSRRAFQSVKSARDCHRTASKSTKSIVDNLREQLETWTSTECVGDLNLSIIFHASRSLDRKSNYKEGAYEALYKACWQSEYKTRPKVAELRKLLMDLL